MTWSPSIAPRSPSLRQPAAAIVQLDEVPVAMLCDPDVRRQAAREGGEPAALLDTYLGLIARILADRPPA